MPIFAYDWILPTGLSSQALINQWIVASVSSPMNSGFIPSIRRLFPPVDCWMTESHSPQSDTVAFVGCRESNLATANGSDLVNGFAIATQWSVVPVRETGMHSISHRRRVVTPSTSKHRGRRLEKRRKRSLFLTRERWHREDDEMRGQPQRRELGCDVMMSGGASWLVKVDGRASNNDRWWEMQGRFFERQSSATFRHSDS